MFDNFYLIYQCSSGNVILEIRFFYQKFKNLLVISCSTYMKTMILNNVMVNIIRLILVNISLHLYLMTNYYEITIWGFLMFIVSDARD